MLHRKRTIAITNRELEKNVESYVSGMMSVRRKLSIPRTRRLTQTAENLFDLSRNIVATANAPLFAVTVRIFASFFLYLSPNVPIRLRSSRATIRTPYFRLTARPAAEKVPTPALDYQAGPVCLNSDFDLTNTPEAPVPTFQTPRSPTSLSPICLRICIG